MSEGVEVTSARPRTVVAGAALVLVFAIGVFLLVRLAMAAPSSAQDRPVTSPSADASSEGGAAAVRNGPDVRGPDDSGLRSDGAPIAGGSDPRGGSVEPGPRGAGAGAAQVPGAGPGSADPKSDEDSPTSIDGNGRQGGLPPRPGTVLVSPSVQLLYIPIFSGDNAAPIYEGETFNLGLQQSFHFAVPARVVDMSISTDEPGQALILTTPRPAANMVECSPGVIAEPMTDGFRYLCTMGIRMSESARPDFEYEGRVALVLEATCTARTGAPCDSLPAEYSPAPDNPIDIRFIADHWVAFEKKQ